MKRILFAALLILIVLPAVSQHKKRGKVKRKYRDVERMSETLPQVVYRGLVRDAAKIPVPGASVEIEGLNRRVHSNENGLFMLSDLPTGRLRLKASALGYRTKTIDFMMQPGYNDHYLTLDRENIHFQPFVSVLQKREQQISDIPAAFTGISENQSRMNDITGFEKLADFVPSLNFITTGSGNSGFSIRGATGFSGFPAISTPVAITFNQVPVSTPGGFHAQFFDMQQVEVISGPGNVLFGRNGMNGAVTLSSTKPGNSFEGYVTAGGGNFGRMETRAAVTLPVLRNILSVRVAGVYFDRKGYLKTAGGENLNGENLAAGRFSLRFTPAFNHVADVVLNYARSNIPGTAFVNPWASGYDGNDSIVNSMNGTSGWQVSKLSLAEATFTYRYYRDEHNYWTFITSLRENDGFNRRDADGTPLAALEMEDSYNNMYFFQEIRFNFVRKSRSNGSFGLNYISENKSFSGTTSSDDQLLYAIMKMPGNFLLPSDTPVPVHPRLFSNDPMAGIPLNGFHSEDFKGKSFLGSVQTFFHLTYQIRHRLFITAGARAIYEHLSLEHEASGSSASESASGIYTGASPNLLYAPASLQYNARNNLSLTGQAGFMYRQNENFNLYVNVSNGRRPMLLQVNGESKISPLRAENLSSLEAGWKSIIGQRVFWEVAGYYRMHYAMHTFQHRGIAGHRLVSADGKGVSYGAETSLKAVVGRGFYIFGNYAWMQSAFDSLNIDRKPFIYAGNSFSFAPGHAFTTGFSAETRITRGMRIFTSPWYAWKSHFWLTDANTPGLEQPAYGILNLNLGIEMEDPAVILSVYATNLLDVKYSLSAGHHGAMFGIPTLIPGPPRMFGAKITWKF